MPAVEEDARAPDAGGVRARSRAVRLFSTRHLPSVIVLVVLIAISIVTSVLLRGVVRNQEHRLLKEHTSELVAYLNSVIAPISSGLDAAGEAVAVDGAHSPLFAKFAAPLSGGGATVAVAQRRAGRFVTVAAVGTRATVGAPVSAEQAALLQRASRTKGGLVYAIATSNGTRSLMTALRVRAAVPTIGFSESVLPKPRPVPTTKNSPYRELNVALYAGTKQDPSRLLLVSGGVPGPSDETVKTLSKLGVDPLLLVTAPHGSLVGGFAESMPWIILGGGIVLALLIALLVEVLSRRREYAFNLVEERTREMYQAQVAAEAANQSKSEFLSRMSHELRTPLNAVLGFSQLLELDDLTTDQQQAVGQITRGGRHLLDLINEILDISQIETGMLAMSPEALNVNELITESTELIRPLARERGVHLLDTDGQACDVYLFADRQRLKQILLNLLGNAIKYNRTDGTVSITCARPTQGKIRVLVTDTGPGIPKEQFELLFTPFERLGAERTTVEGTGIGLALSRRLAEVMGGSMGVESSVGRGATFWVEFPIAEGPVARAERLDQLGGRAVVSASEHDRPPVLHIEDNLSNTKLIERVLAQRPGVQLISAMQGRLGLDLARQHHPALILLDLNLADIAGEEVLHLLRDDPATAQIPVVIVSADAMPRQVQRLLSGGATAYLTKPIDVRQLLEVVDMALEAHARRAEPVGAGHAEEVPE